MSRAGSAGANFMLVDTAVAISYPFSCCAWFWCASTDAARQVSLLWMGDKDSANMYHSLHILNGLASFESRAASSYNSYVDSTAGYTTSTWQHALATSSSSTNRTIYLNGGNSATNTDAGNVTGIDRTAMLRLADSTPNNSPLACSVAETAVWNRVLTADEIAALSKGFAPSHFKQGLVAYWPLIGTNSPETDFKGGVNLSITGTVVKADHPKIIYPH